MGAALAERLTARGVEVLAVDDRPDADDLLARLDGWLAAGPIQGVYWLAALDEEGPIGEMDLAGWREANRVRVKLLYATMRRLYDHDLGGRAPSSWPPPASAAATATTRPAPPPRWAARSPASPRRSPASAPTRW